MDKEKYIIFNTRDMLLRISQSQIMCFCADKNYTDMFLTTGRKFTFTYGLSAMQKHLEESLKEDVRYFVRLGKSAIANLQFVYRIDLLKQILELYDPVNNKYFTLKVSKESLKSLKQFFKEEI
ncbi:MAG: LytTR family transcriptional regulator [Prevotellaceae bacterium]|jgi:DNA-binding LytR/AlgR family response regulator|nr:LytTR family transcriptional regulator [Prevotellaceae bacterium]